MEDHGTEGGRELYGGCEEKSVEVQDRYEKMLKSMQVPL